MPIPAFVPSLGNHYEAPFFSTKHRQPTRVKSMVGIFFVLLLLSVSAFAQGPTIPGVTSLTVKSEVLGEDRRILVRTPQGYEAGKQRYPVLYLLDGDAHIAHTSSTVEFLARNGRMSELIVVAIPNTDRTRDLSPTHITTTGATGAPQP